MPPRFPWALVGTLNFSAHSSNNNRKGETKQNKPPNQIFVNLKHATSFNLPRHFGGRVGSCNSFLSLHLGKIYIWEVNQVIGLEL